MQAALKLKFEVAITQAFCIIADLKSGRSAVW